MRCDGCGDLPFARSVATKPWRVPHFGSRVRPGGDAGYSTASGSHLIPAVFYAGSFKEEAAAGLDPSIRPYRALCLLVLAVFFHALLRFLGGIFQPNLGERIRGQVREISAFLLSRIVTGSYFYTASPAYGFTELSRFLAIGGSFFSRP